MANDVATQPKWKGTLEKAMPKMADALPAHITQDKFRQVAATAIGNTPMLRECMESNPAKVLTALTQCASDGLLPNGKQAALVPFRSKGGMDLTYIPMIAGVLQRMRNSGEVESVSARIVYEQDEFEVVYGDEEKIVHTPCKTGKQGDPIGAYAIIRLTSGEVYREYMTRAEIMQVKNASRAKGGPWSGPFETEMWRKTVLKRAAKYCPFSDDVAAVLDRDNNFYDPDKTIDATPRPDVRERFAADMAEEEPAIAIGEADEPIEDAEIIDPEEQDSDVSPLQSSDEEAGEQQPPPRTPASTLNAANEAAKACLLRMQKAKNKGERTKAFDTFMASEEADACDKDLYKKILTEYEK
jgi:recombination protein RecT